MSRPHAVYRCFSMDGDLLYVGCSWSPMTRAMEHCKMKPWAVLMARIDVEWFDSKDEALRAEIKAIGSEHPIWNCHFSNRPRRTVGRRDENFRSTDQNAWEKEGAAK